MKIFLYFIILYFMLVGSVFSFYMDILDRYETRLVSTQNKILGVEYLKILDDLSINIIEYLLQHTKEKDSQKMLISKNIEDIYAFQDKNSLYHNDVLNKHLVFIKKFNHNYNDINYNNFFEYVNHENYIIGNKAEILFSQNQEQYFLGTLLTHYIPEFIISIGMLHNVLEEMVEFKDKDLKKKSIYFEHSKLAYLSAQELEGIIDLLKEYGDTKELSRLIISIDNLLQKLKKTEKTNAASLQITYKLFEKAKQLNNINRELLDTLLKVDVEYFNDKILFYRLLLVFWLLLVSALFIYFFRIFNANVTKDEELVELNESLIKRVKKEVAVSRKKDRQIIEQSRLAQMGEMISMIAHQWRQPLAAIGSTSASLELKANLNKLDKDTAIKLARNISSYAQHLSSTIDDFRDFFKSNKEKADTTYSQVIKSVLGIVETSIKNKNISLIQKFDTDEVFSSYPNELKQVILNLLKNSEDILSEKNIVDPYIKIHSYSSEDLNILTISDNGGGVPDESINKIFDPYFSTKLSKNGTGLGLYMSKVIIEEHCDGKLDVKNDEHGAVFSIRLNKGS